MSFAIFYLLQPVMKIPYPLLNDMMWCLFACEVLGIAVTYIMQFLRVNQFSACLEAPSWWTNDDYYTSEASKNHVFIQKRFLASALLPWCSVLALTQAVVCTLLLLGLDCSEGLAKTFHDDHPAGQGIGQQAPSNQAARQWPWRQPLPSALDWLPPSAAQWAIRWIIYPN